MAVLFIGELNVPNYTALSSDIGLDGIIPAVAKKGRIVYLTDTAVWKIVLPDLTLGDYALPISFNGSVDIGAVHLDQQLTDSVEISPFYSSQSVTVPGTSESLSATDLFVLSVVVYPRATNTDNVYLGTSGVDKTTSQQIILTPTSPAVGFDVPVGYKLNLKNFYIDAIDAGNGVEFLYLK